MSKPDEQQADQSGPRRENIPREAKANEESSRGPEPTMTVSSVKRRRVETSPEPAPASDLRHASVSQVTEYISDAENEELKGIIKKRCQLHAKCKVDFNTDDVVVVSFSCVDGETLKRMNIRQSVSAISGSLARLEQARSNTDVGQAADKHWKVSGEAIQNGYGMYACFAGAKKASSMSTVVLSNARNVLSSTGFQYQIHIGPNGSANDEPITIVFGSQATVLTGPFSDLLVASELEVHRVTTRSLSDLVDRLHVHFTVNQTGQMHVNLEDWEAQVLAQSVAIMQRADVDCLGWSLTDGKTWIFGVLHQDGQSPDTAFTSHRAESLEIHTTDEGIPVDGLEQVFKLWIYWSSTAGKELSKVMKG